MRRSVGEVGLVPSSHAATSRRTPLCRYCGQGLLRPCAAVPASGMPWHLLDAVRERGAALTTRGRAFQSGAGAAGERIWAFTVAIVAIGPDGLTHLRARSQEEARLALLRGALATVVLAKRGAQMQECAERALAPRHPGGRAGRSRFDSVIGPLPWHLLEDLARFELVLPPRSLGALVLEFARAIEDHDPAFVRLHPPRELTALVRICRGGLKDIARGRMDAAGMRGRAEIALDLMREREGPR